MRIHEGMNVAVSPDTASFEVVERKFRGHPDSLADLVAQTFSKKYIEYAWKTFPALFNRHFPNFSADKVTISGASTYHVDGTYKVTKPIDALLIGKITPRIGDIEIDVDGVFREAIEQVFVKCLQTTNFKHHLRTMIYSVDLAGPDHGASFYCPESVEQLIETLKAESRANDTVYIVAYAPLSVTESLSIHLEQVTYSQEFRQIFPEIGTDIKAMIRRNRSEYDITLCLPILPEKVSTISVYESIIANAKEFLLGKIESYLQGNAEKFPGITVQLHVNTKDTASKKYFALWGTSLTKGDVGAVGRGNRQQGFISGVRPSTNEAVSGKNPNHFAGIVCQLAADRMSQEIFLTTQLENIIYISANNGDALDDPSSVDILVAHATESQKEEIQHIINVTLAMLPELRQAYIDQEPFDRFMGFKK